LYCTLAIVPPDSLALAVIEVDPDTVALLIGVVMLTVGVGLFTVTENSDGYSASRDVAAD